MVEDIGRGERGEGGRSTKGELGGRLNVATPLMRRIIVQEFIGWRKSCIIETLFSHGNFFLNHSAVSGLSIPTVERWCL